MDIYTPVKNYLKTCNGRELEALSALSSVPVTTINKIKTGETKNPGVLTVQKIFDVLDALHERDGKNRRKLVYGRRESDNGRRRKVIKPE